MLDPECIQLVYEKELWFRSRGLGHVHVRVSVQQFVQPRRSGPRSAGNDKGWSLSWHVPEDNVCVDRIRPNVTIQRLAALWHTTPARVTIVDLPFRGTYVRQRFSGTLSVSARVWVKCGQANADDPPKLAALCVVLACTVGDRAKHCLHV